MYIVLPFHGELMFLRKALQKEKQYTTHPLLKEFADKNLSHGGLNTPCKKIDKFSSVDHCVVNFTGAADNRNTIR